MREFNQIGGNMNLPAETTSKIGFQETFERFNDLVLRRSGQPFTRFDRGLIHDWESYKPRLREHALGLLAADRWQESDVGSGNILNSTIAAIEIDLKAKDLTNNLVSWPNRYGHASRDHRALIDAKVTGKGRRELERALFDLYRSNRDDGVLFDELSELTGRKYPLLGYLFFLKNMDRYLPIHPTGFDRFFKATGIELTTLSNCSWENYTAFNRTIDGLRSRIELAAGISGVRPIDAHSFVWVFSYLLKEDAEGKLNQVDRNDVRYLGAKEKSIAEIKYSVGQTTFKSNGQVVQRTVKNKELLLDSYELDRLIRELFEVQGDCCNITGLPFQFHGTHTDPNMLPSLDRIDSDKHYERGNLQIVCRFINFWKQASPNEEFRRLIAVVRGVELE